MSAFGDGTKEQAVFDALEMAREECDLPALHFVAIVLKVTEYLIRAELARERETTK